MTSVKRTKRPRSAPVELTLALLEEYYPNAHCELHHRNPFELLVATALSAQCTDEMVNRATPGLFDAFPGPAALAAAPLEEVELRIRSIGLYRNKAKNIRELSRVLVEKHRGEVPRTLEELVELAGVGRKTANVVLGNAFGIASGVVVDTHVARLSRRFGWTEDEDPVRIERTLCQLIPKDRWVRISHELIFHGRRVCKARNPACSECFLNEICPKREVESSR